MLHKLCARKKNVLFCLYDVGFFNLSTPLNEFSRVAIWKEKSHS